MNKTILFILMLLHLILTPTAWGTPKPFEMGKDYQRTGPKVATSPIVEEFFNYACGACYSMENFVTKLKSENPGLKVKPVPIELRPSWKIYVKAYYIGEKLGVLEKSHAKLFHRIHVEKKHFKDETDMKMFFVQLGVTQKAYDDVAKSYWLASQLKQAKQYALKHRISGSPIFLVNQQYKLNNRSLGTYPRIEEAIKKLSGIEQS